MGLEVGVGLECAELEEGRGCCTTKIELKINGINNKKLH